MAEGLPSTPEGWGGVIAGIAAVFIAARKGLQKLGITDAPPNIEAIAKAVVAEAFAQKSREDTEHREAILAGFEAAIDKLSVSMERLLERIHHETAGLIAGELRGIRDEYADIKSDTRVILERMRGGK